MNPLQIFPKHPSAPDTYYIGGGWSPACITAIEKRFHPGELAAEYWSQYANYVREASNLLHCQERHMEAAGASFKEADRKTSILHRFAELPHYDENPA